MKSTPPPKGTQRGQGFPKPDANAWQKMDEEQDQERQNANLGPNGQKMEPLTFRRLKAILALKFDDGDFVSETDT